MQARRRAGAEKAERRIRSGQKVSASGKPRAAETDIRFGDALRSARRTLGLSVRDFAVKAGLAPSMLSRIENGGRKDLRLSTAVRLCRAAGLSLDYVTGLSASVDDLKLERIRKLVRDLSGAVEL